MKIVICDKVTQNWQTGLDFENSFNSGGVCILGENEFSLVIAVDRTIDFDSLIKRVLQDFVSNKVEPDSLI